MDGLVFLINTYEVLDFLESVQEWVDPCHKDGNVHSQVNYPCGKDQGTLPGIYHETMLEVIASEL